MVFREGVAVTKLYLAAAAVLVAGWGMAGARAEAGEWHGSSGIGSGAFGVSARIVSDGSATHLPPAPVVFGTGEWHYNRTANRADLSETLGIAAAGQQIATLQVTAGHLRVHAASNGVAIDHVEPTADGSIDSVEITLQAYPAPSTGTPPLLSIIGSGITWQASDSETFPKTPVVAGAASFTSMTITGSLVNGDTVNITGTRPANTTLVLGATGNVRIVVNQEITAGAIACTPTCTFIPSGITTEALAVHLQQAAIGTQTVSGTIVLGEARANVGL